MKIRVALLILLIANVAQATVKYENTAKLHWKAVAHAKVTGVQIRSGSRVVEEKQVPSEETSVLISLAPGKYTYRLQSIDIAGRKGPWSRDLEFVIRPGPPVATESGGAEVAVKGLGDRRQLRWEESGDAAKYHVRVLKDGEPLLEKDVTSGEVEVPLPGVGKYRYSVASIRDGVVGPYSDWAEFAAVQFKLDAPGQQLPGGRVPLGAGKVTLKWSKVSGAEAYEVRLIPKKRWKVSAIVEDGARAKASAGWHPAIRVEGADYDGAVSDPGSSTVVKRDVAAAQEPPKEKSWVTSTNGMAIEVQADGQYTWKVRALAGVNQQGQASSKGPEAAADLEIFRKDDE